MRRTLKSLSALSHLRQSFLLTRVFSRSVLRKRSDTAAAEKTEETETIACFRSFRFFITVFPVFHRTFTHSVMPQWLLPSPLLLPGKSLSVQILLSVSAPEFPFPSFPPKRTHLLSACRCPGTVLNQSHRTVLYIQSFPIMQEIPFIIKNISIPCTIGVK